MLIHPGDAGPLLEELLASADDASFAMALTVSREIDSTQVTHVLVASLPALLSPRAAQVVQVLGDRGDPLRATLWCSVQTAATWRSAPRRYTLWDERATCRRSRCC